MTAKLDLASAVKAGILGTVAMTVVMYGLPLVGLPAMDIMATLGSVFPFEISPYVPGSLIHLGIGVVLALVYAAFFYTWLPGPNWMRGALFSLLPWLFAITLLGPSLQLAAQMFGNTRSGSMANPCAPKAAVNPCAPQASNPCAPANPCAVKPPTNPCAPQAANPCATKPVNPCAAQPMNPCAPGAGNPCAVPANPCAAQPTNPCAPTAVNPCAPAAQSRGGVPPQVLSLIVHLIYGVVLGVLYRPRG